MILVLEGLPASGKTSVANYLKKFFNFYKVNESLGHLGGVNLSDDQMIIFEETVKKYGIAKNVKENSIIDRGYASMLAWDYCAVNLKKAYNFSTKKKWVNGALKTGKLYEPTFYIYLEISPETSLLRRPRPEDNKDVWTSLEGLKYCIGYYDKFFKNKEIKKKTIFIKAEKDFDDVIMQIITLLSL